MRRIELQAPFLEQQVTSYRLILHLVKGFYTKIIQLEGKNLDES